MFWKKLIDMNICDCLLAWEEIHIVTISTQSLNQAYVDSMNLLDSFQVILTFSNILDLSILTKNICASYN